MQPAEAEGPPHLGLGDGFSLLEMMAVIEDQWRVISGQWRAGKAEEQWRLTSGKSRSQGKGYGEEKQERIVTSDERKPKAELQ